MLKKIHKNIRDFINKIQEHMRIQMRNMVQYVGLGTYNLNLRKLNFGIILQLLKLPHAFIF